MVDTSDLLLVLGAIVIFSIAVLNVNRGITRNQLLMTQAELEYTGIALGQDLIDEARIKAFDEATTTATPSNIPGAFSQANKFGGANDGEAYPAYDDFDDYDGYQRQDTTEHGIYRVTASVVYVTENAPNTAAGGKTAFKRLNVVVSSPFLDHDITLSYLKPF